MAKTKIEWTELTWNPVTGCTKYSSGCDNCYAFAMARRLQGRYGYPVDDPFRVTLRPNRLDQPLDWKKSGLVFVCSMADLFHKDVPTEYILQVIDVMRRADHHIFQVLTKRAHRLGEIEQMIEWPDNVWLGVTVESSKYQRRIDYLRFTTASVKFLSIEPLLGAMHDLDLDGIDWVIVGGEVGTRSRPVKAEWVTDIRDQCQAAGTPFFFKQWGGRKPKVAGRMLEGVTWDEMPQQVVKTDS
ncbi:MAG: phage Gp37/Gp68 family protein [Magnetococcales bacterium]|nr:phage Gp37/Gp68 family protein [Magnetococcales bacterium]